jgi:hypothetical protein
MKQFFIFLTAAAIISFSGCNMQNKTAIAQSETAKQNQSNKLTETKSKSPVLVELFTSEGCSSCPPADRVLAQLEKEQPIADAEIITLALHVDYWNYLGWRDEFSQKQFSERQNGYVEKFKIESVYTPQMVVDGQAQLVGSNHGAANKAISDALKTNKATIELSNAGNKLKIKISELPAHDDSYVWLAIAEDNLKTNVRRGENSGRTLDHVSVAREMKLLGNLAAADKSFESETVLQLNSNWKKENLKFIVFVQGKDSKRVFGVKKFEL